MQVYGCTRIVFGKSGSLSYLEYRLTFYNVCAIMHINDPTSVLAIPFIEYKGNNMTATSVAVYSTSTSGIRGHVAHFEVEERPFNRDRYLRTVIHLPEACQLLGEFGDPLVETKFYDDAFNGFIYAHTGGATDGLLSAAKVFIDNALKPYDPRIGVRAVASDGRVALIGYINRDIDLDAFCEDLAEAIYEDVADVDVQHVRAGHMGVRERREWNDYQLIDY